MVFSFELKINHAKMAVVNNLVSNQNLMFSLNLRKINQDEMKMVDDFLMRSQGVY